MFGETYFRRLSSRNLSHSPLTFKNSIKNANSPCMLTPASSSQRDGLVVLRKARDNKVTQKLAIQELEVSERQVRRLLRKLNTDGDIVAVRG